MADDFIDVQVSVGDARGAMRRILSRSVRSESGCLEHRRRASHKYPVIMVRGISYYCSRVVLTAKLGRVLSCEDYVLHSCDNCFCVDEDHLSAGTQEQNVSEAMVRGRSIGRRPLDASMLRRILDASLTVRQAAFVSGVSTATVASYRRKAKLAAGPLAAPPV